MEWHQALVQHLRIVKGITSVIGSGGKTTLLRALSDALDGTVLLCTSTHIVAWDDIPLDTGCDRNTLASVIQKERVVCTGVPVADGIPRPQPKLTAPALPFSVLASLADYVLVEADGSKRLPLKAHAPYEPVIPAGSGQTVLVVGAAGFGETVRDAVHRPELFCPLCGLQPDDIVTPQAVARVVGAEALADTVFVNQADMDTRIKDARLFAAHLPENRFQVIAGSLYHRSALPL
ncbi:MAG: putative selenium-dependent hydroxylase accessory protein YqeC [Butyrivibrio sp.]|nr:putative selenium-dependent hydroxylase accessory protein YqeC [Butyrivibrio sp.]